MKRLPKRHRFPGGFVVTVVEAPCPSERLDEGDEGDYWTIDRGSAQITIWNQLTPRQKWVALAHEMIHAAVDAQNYIEKTAR